MYAAWGRTNSAFVIDSSVKPVLWPDYPVKHSESFPLIINCMLVLQNDTCCLILIYSFFFFKFQE